MDRTNETEKREPLHAWITLAGSTFLMLLIIGNNRSFGLIYLELLDLFNEGPVKTNLFATLYAAIIAIFGPVSGYIGDRVQSRWLIITAGIVGALCNIGSSLAPNLTVITIVYGAIMGCCSCLIFPNCMSEINMIFLKQRGLANGIAFTGGALGELAVPLLYQYLIENFTVRGLFLIQAGLISNAAAIGNLFRAGKNIKEDKAFHGTCCLGKQNQCAIDLHLNDIKSNEVENIISISFISLNDERRNDQQGLGELLPDIAEGHLETHVSTAKLSSCKTLISVQFICIIWEFLFSNMAWTGFVAFVPAFMEDRGYLSSQISIIFATIGACGLPANILFGHFGDLNIVNRRVTIAFSLTVMCAAVISLPFIEAFPVFCICCAIIGIFSSVPQVNAAPLLVEILGEGRIGFGYGVISLLYGVSYSLSSLILSGIKEATGSFVLGFIMTAIFYAISAIAAVISQIHWTHTKN